MFDSAQFSFFLFFVPKFLFLSAVNQYIYSTFHYVTLFVISQSTKKNSQSVIFFHNINENIEIPVKKKIKISKINPYNV